MNVWEDSDDALASSGECVNHVPDNVSQLPLHSVSFHGIANRFGYDEADQNRILVGYIYSFGESHVNHETRCLSSRPISDNITKLIRGSHPVVARKHVALGRQLCAALAAAASQNGAASTSCHALAETVYLSPLTVVGLESPLHHRLLHSLIA